MSGQLALRPVKVQGSKPNIRREPAGPCVDWSWQGLSEYGLVPSTAV